MGTIPDLHTVEQTSALAPAGPAAQTILDLTWWMVSVFGAVFFVVMLLLFLAIRMRRKDGPREAPLGDHLFISVGGIIVPSLILIVFLLFTLIITGRLDEGPRDALTIRLTGHMWWWDVHYPGSGIITANEIHIPIQTRVRIELSSQDVIHSLWVPSLAGKTDLLPGIPGVQWLEASQPGKYRGQCAEYCGVQHSWMALYVVAHPKEEYLAWEKAMRRGAIPLEDARQKRGLDTFHRVGCASCHTIQGTTASGKAGPDLTHMGSRLSIGAGRAENNLGNLIGWISNPQAIKPGNKMPMTPMAADELHDLASYLMSLK